jgi:hypothetical protein
VLSKLHEQESKLEKKLRKLQRAGKTDVTITAGTTPSGKLHLGNVYTFVNGIIQTERACRKAGVTPHYIIGFNDLAGSSRGEGEHIDPIHTIPLVYAEPEKVAQRRRDLASLVRAIKDRHEVDVTIVDFSKMQKKTGFRKLLVEIADNPGFSVYAFARHKVTLHKVCDGCKYKIRVTGQTPHSKPRPHKGFSFYTRQQTDDVPERCFSDAHQGMVGVSIEGLDLSSTKKNVFAFEEADTMLLRDVFYKADVHIVGGDYEDRVEELHRKYAQLRDTYAKPFFYYTEKVLGRDGNTMHTSSQNGLLLSDPQKIHSWLIKLEKLAESQRAQRNTVIEAEAYRHYFCPPQQLHLGFV